MLNPSYGYTKSLGATAFETAVTRVKAALLDQGFGVLTEIDIQATFKAKLDVDYPKYMILGACNPHFAFGALQREPAIGLLLPCKAIIVEEQDGTISVSLAKPAEMFQVIENADLAPLAAEVDAMLQRAMAAL